MPLRSLKALLLCPLAYRVTMTAGPGVTAATAGRSRPGYPLLQRGEKTG